MPHSLSKLIADVVPHLSVTGGDAQVSGICDHTDNVVDGSLFVCMPSSSVDTHSFIGQALSKGAAAAIVRDSAGLEIALSHGVPAVLVSTEGNSFNESVGLIARGVLDDPLTRLTLIGITGTNGKTTTALALADALESAGVTCAYMGTLGLFVKGNSLNINNTTPFPVEFWNSLRAIADEGASMVAMEVSSHALDQARIAGAEFAVGVFTNLSQDHLDYHSDMRQYEESKKLLFTKYQRTGGDGFRAVLNVSDEVGSRWASEFGKDVVTYGTSESDVWIETTSMDIAGTKGDLHVEGVVTPIEAQLVGQYNLYNLEAVSATLHALGYSPNEIAEMLREVKPVPGRFEVIRGEDGVSAIVDYAHTPEAVSQLLIAVRGVASGRICTVIGCGGDRDRTKRPKMAAAACAGSDRVVLTSDNPRTEDPDAILDEVEAGVPDGYPYKREVDRCAAIDLAIREARPGDVIVIAGKGHEDYQIIGRTKHHMDDRVMARESLAARGAGARK